MKYTKTINYKEVILSIFRERPRTFSAGMDSGDTEGVLSFSQ
jgi:hypothetical protein